MSYAKAKPQKSKQEDTTMKAKVGDKVSAMGITAEIGKIIYQFYFNGAWDIEFVDSYGNYRHWKQEFDGGKLIQR